MDFDLTSRITIVISVLSLIQSKNEVNFLKSLNDYDVKYSIFFFEVRCGLNYFCCSRAPSHLLHLSAWGHQFVYRIVYAITIVSFTKKP